MAGPAPSELEAMFDGHLEVRPPLADDQLAAIPAKRGVFLLTAEGDRPILLATAASIRARLRGRLDETVPDQPHRSADLRSITRAVLWKLAGGHFQTDLTFLELARAIWPRGYAKLLSWRPAWFIHVDPSARFPHFARSREVFAEGGLYLGPFESGRSADRFIEIVQDAFDLCRDVQCLRRSPHGPRCAYGQMGRCLSPCDGTTPMEEYRRVMAQAADFAAGRRQEKTQLLRGQMKAAAAELRFEQAAALKARLDRLGDLDEPCYRLAAPAGEFRFLMIEPSGSRRAARPFLVDRGAVRAEPLLRYPLAEEELLGLLARMAAFAAEGGGRAVEPVDRWRMGLVARALQAGIRQGGVVLRWREGLSAAEVAGAIDAAAAELGLSSRHRDNDQPPGSAEGTATEA